MTIDEQTKFKRWAETRGLSYEETLATLRFLNHEGARQECAVMYGIKQLRILELTQAYDKYRGW